MFFYIFCQNFFIVKILSDLTDFLLTSPRWAPVCWKTIFFLKDIFTSSAHRTPTPKTFTYFEKYRLKKSSKYCMMIIFEIFHCNMYWFRLSFLWLICFHRIFVFLISFRLFKIILGLQHKIVALAPGRKSLLLFTLKSFGCLPLEPIDWRVE